MSKQAQVQRQLQKLDRRASRFVRDLGLNKQETVSVEPDSIELLVDNKPVQIRRSLRAIGAHKFHRVDTPFGKAIGATMPNGDAVEYYWDPAQPRSERLVTITMTHFEENVHYSKIAAAAEAVEGVKLSIADIATYYSGLGDGSSAKVERFVRRLLGRSLFNYADRNGLCTVFLEYRLGLTKAKDAEVDVRMTNEEAKEMGY